MTDRDSYCTFRVGDLLLGVDVLRVQEVIRWQPMTRVPLAPPAVRGLINLRGRIVAAIDLRRRLGLTPFAAADRPVNLVVRTADGPVSLLVDEVGDVVGPDGPGLGNPPGSTPEAVRAAAVGIYEHGHELMIVIDTDRVVGSGDRAGGDA